MVKSFFGFRLSTAAVVIGWIGGIVYLILSVLDIICLANVDTIVNIITNQTNNSIPLPEPDTNYNTDPDTVKFVLTIVLALYLILNVVNGLSSVLLVIGTLKERHLHLIPFLFNYGIYVLYILLSSVSYAILLIMIGAPVGVIILTFIYSFISFAFSMYVWSAVYSLFQIFRSATDQQRLIPGTTYPSYTSI